MRKGTELKWRGFVGEVSTPEEIDQAEIHIHEAARVHPRFPEIDRLRPLLAFFMNVVVSGVSNSLCLAEQRLFRVGLRFAEESELVEVGRGCTPIFRRRRWGRQRQFNRK